LVLPWLCCLNPKPLLIFEPQTPFDLRVHAGGSYAAMLQRVNELFPPLVAA